MNNVFDSLKLTLFEIVGYVLPGVFLEIVICLFLPFGISGFTDYLPILLLLSYPLGQVLHSTSTILDFNAYDIMWKIYHLVKEKDEYGHGVKDPKTKLGKFAMSLRRFIEKHVHKQEKDDINQLLKSQFALEKVEAIDLYFLKESILAESSSIATNFEHLHYQKIFNKSIALIFACLTLFIPMTPLLGLTSIRISNMQYLAIHDHVLLLTLICAVMFKIFYDRATFFKNYRDKIMNSAVRIYLQNRTDK